MSLSDIASVSILTTTVALTAAGFGTPLILGEFATSVFGGTTRIRAYGGMDEVAADFASTTPEFRAADKCFQQKPAPAQVKIGRRPPGTTNIQTLTVSLAIDDTDYTLTLYGFDVTINSGTGATTTTIRDALLAAIIADTNTFPLTAVASAATVIILTSDFSPVGIEASEADANLALVDTTPFVASAESVTDALTAVSNEDDDWYGLITISRITADITAGANYVQSRIKLYRARDNSTEAVDSGDATDPGSVLQAAGLGRSAVEYNTHPWDFPDAAHMANRLAFNPDSTTTTWIYNDLTGVRTDALTTSEKNALKGKNISYFIVVSGVRLTFEGKQADGEFTDVVLGGDWLGVRLQEDVLVAQVEAVKVGGKIPYTDGGVQVLEGVLRRRLEIAEGTGLITDDFVINLPDISDASAGQKADREAPAIKFSATLQGAIHKSNFEGTLSVA